MTKPFNCIKCGECCRQIVIPITHSDIIRWVQQERKDILRQVTFCRGAPQGDGFYLEQTITAPKKPCPFLVNDQCGIHETKPRACRDAPHSMTSFSVCSEWSEACIDRKRLKKIRRKQEKDFKKCVVHFKELMEITFRAKGIKRKVKINGN